MSLNWLHREETAKPVASQLTHPKPDGSATTGSNYRQDVTTHRARRHRPRGSQVVGLIGDAHRAAGDAGAAARAFDESLSIMAASGHDEGSAAAKARARLVDTLLEAGDADRALRTVEGMLSYARNVHITEYATTLCCLEKVVTALAARGRAHLAVHAAETLLEVRCQVPGLYLVSSSCRQGMMRTLSAHSACCCGSVHRAEEFRSRALQARVNAFGDTNVATALPRRVLASALLDSTGASRHTLAAMQAYLASEALQASLHKLKVEVELYRNIPRWAFWGHVSENFGVHLLLSHSINHSLPRHHLVFQLAG
jgi:tetratricopeptide (TPR) repeat protein